MRSQRGEAETGGEAGERAHPRAFWLCCGRRGCRLTRGLGGRGLMRVVRGDRLALHAGRAAAAEAFRRFGIVDLQAEAEHQRCGHHYEVFHPCLLFVENDWRSVTRQLSWI
ncbi:hypothetical protein SDC9_200282 [bioreactor metagenome]|uniref:Uncharacterized protein n=1 Tax=bioreactor metagenome TaxID=1076179 RepID=A0A645INE4_9ZZZZ